MKILHIAAIKNDPCSGVCVVVPAHINHQKDKAKVALLNIVNSPIDEIEKQFLYTGGDWTKNVSEEFMEPDIVIFHEVYHIEFARIANSLRKRNIPYVIIPHGCLVVGAQHKKRWKKIIANIFFFHSFIYKASSIQYLSEDESKNTLFNVPSFVCTNGMEIPSVHKDKFPDNEIIISYVGRLEYRVKGLDLLIEAVSRIKDTLIDNHVLIHIYGPDRDASHLKIKKLIDQYHVNDLIVVHDAILFEKKVSVLLNSDLFIQTSRHEGMPMGILEAMSLGIPCIITRGTSLGDIVEKNDAGWVADNNVNSISDCIIEALKKKEEWEWKSRNARNLLISRYSWSIISREMLNFYQKHTNI